MCVVGAATTTRWTCPAESISCATRSPNVVLPAAGVAEARNLVDLCPRSATRAASCQARSGRSPGQGGSACACRATAVLTGSSPFFRVGGAGRLGARPEGTGAFPRNVRREREGGVPGRRLMRALVAAAVAAALAAGPAAHASQDPNPPWPQLLPPFPV